MVCHGLPPNLVEYFQPGIVNRIHLSKGPIGYLHENIFSDSWSDSTRRFGGPQGAWLRGFFYNTSFGFWCLGVGSWSWSWSWGLFGVRLAWGFAKWADEENEHGQVGWSETDGCWASWNKPLWNGDACGVNNISSTCVFLGGIFWWTFLGGVHPSKMSGYVKVWFGKHGTWMVFGGYDFDGSLLEAKIWQRWCITKGLCILLLFGSLFFEDFTAPDLIIWNPWQWIFRSPPWWFSSSVYIEPQENIVPTPQLLDFFCGCLRIVLCNHLESLGPPFSVNKCNHN